MPAPLKLAHLWAGNPDGTWSPMGWQTLDEAQRKAATYGRMENIPMGASRGRWETSWWTGKTTWIPEPTITGPRASDLAGKLLR